VASCRYPLSARGRFDHPLATARDRRRIAEEIAALTGLATVRGGFRADGRRGGIIAPMTGSEPRDDGALLPPHIEDLRANVLFADLDDGQLEWLAQAGEHRLFQDGSILFREGDHADRLVVLLDGELLVSHVVDGRDEVLARHSTRHDDPVGADGTAKPAAAHGFTGETPLLAEDDYIATATAVGATRVLLFARAVFMEMIVRCPGVCRVLLPVLAWRIHASAAQAGQRATVTALGTLAAGLAHELNNPAAAVVRAADALAVAVTDLHAAAMHWAAVAGPADTAVLDALASELNERAVLLAGRDALADAETEERIEDWLDDIGSDALGLVRPLVERGMDIPWLDALAARLSGPLVAPALTSLSAAMTTRSLVADIGDAGLRISGIVAAAREYTNLDRAPEQDFDLARGIEATLSMLAPKLTGIRVHREYSADLPLVVGYPIELNQVWTNLVDNAVDAMDGDGDLWLRTSRDGACVLAEVADSGPGIAPDLQSRIFEPFFTTKDIGKGTGLGLHLSHRIVTQRHHGSLTVQSRPGSTRFLVRIPVDLTSPPGPGAEAQREAAGS
jgi:signal transduction histidine kinase